MRPLRSRERGSPSLNGLRAPEAARRLSFTCAAAELNVTQTEAQLGLRLFAKVRKIPHDRHPGRGCSL